MHDRSASLYSVSGLGFPSDPGFFEMLSACFLVGTLNLLGDASNPVEFLPMGGNDEDAAGTLRCYQLLERTATSLTSSDVEKLSDAVRAAAAGTV